MIIIVQNNIDLTDFLFSKFKEQGPSVYTHIKQTINELVSEKLIITENTTFASLGVGIKGKTFSLEQIFWISKLLRNSMKLFLVR